jgi:hypothetical protein
MVNSALGAVSVERTAIGVRSFTSGARGTTMVMQHAAPGPASERKSGLRRRSPQRRADFRPGCLGFRGELRKNEESEELARKN